MVLKQSKGATEHKLKYCTILAAAMGEIVVVNHHITVSVFELLI